MATSSTTLKMKLLIDTKKNCVLLAEANKDVVDFLFSLLALPVGRIVDMIGEEYMCGSVGNLFSSLLELDCDYILPKVDKSTLLFTKVVPPAVSTSCSSPLLLEPSDRQRFFRCSSRSELACSKYVTDTSSTNCPNCNNKMSMELEYVDNTGRNVQKASSSKGFVKAVTYTVRDDLTVTPMPNISSMALFFNTLRDIRVTDLSAVREKNVLIDYTKAVEILEASLQSKTVLTDVFLSK